ncbi:hypothetical protein ACVWXO_007896 [Bradyrhizobium sp. LM2.7]
MTGIAAPTAASKFSRPAVLFSGLCQFEAVLGEQRLVGGDDGLAGVERGFDRGERRIAGTAHQFDETVDAGMRGQRHRIPGPFDIAQIEATLLRLRARGDGDDTNAASAAPCEHAGLRFNQTDNFGAHGAEPRYAHFQGCDHDAFRKPVEEN